MGLPPLHADRRRLPILPVLVLLVPLAVALGSLKLLQVRSLSPIKAELSSLRSRASALEKESERLTEEADRLSREVQALQAISKVEIVWGGASADAARIAFPYERAGSAWKHPKDGVATVWYYTDESDTLAQVAAHPRVLGAAHLWPLLGKENGIQVDGNAPLPAGRLLRVPLRIHEYQLRRALTEAGTPDQQRNEILSQAGLKP